MPETAITAELLEQNPGILLAVSLLACDKKRVGGGEEEEEEEEVPGPPKYPKHWTVYPLFWDKVHNFGDFGGPGRTKSRF